MAWTAPRCWTTGEVVTAAIMTTHIKNNFLVTAPAVLTTAGDMLYASGANAPGRLAKGTNGNIIHQASCAPAWTNSPSLTALTLSGALDANGSVDFDGTTLAACASGAITLTSTSSSANGIYLRANGGTSETVKIHSDQGTSVTEGAASVSLLSDAGGVELRSTANLANAVNITVDGGTTSSMTLFNDQGTGATEGSSSIQLLSDVGAIGIKSGLNAAGAIRLTADAGTSETIVIHADQGSGTGSICLTSDAGGITLNPGTFVTVGGNATNAGEMRIFEDTDHGCNYVAMKAPNVSTSYTMTLPTAVAGTCGFVLTSTTSGVLSWAAAAGDVVCDTSPQLGGNLDMQARLLVGNGGSTGIAISAAGEVSMAAQPGVLAYNSASDDNVTGAGTGATVDFDTEVYDQNADFASDTFTAPITGRYLVCLSLGVEQFTTDMRRFEHSIVSSNRSYTFDGHPFNIANGTGGAPTGGDRMHNPWALVIDMDASDTVYVQALVLHGAGDTADIKGGSNGETSLSVWLVG